MIIDDFKRLAGPVRRLDMLGITGLLGQAAQFTKYEQGLGPAKLGLANETWKQLVPGSVAQMPTFMTESASLSGSAMPAAPLSQAAAEGQLAEDAVADRGRTQREPEPDEPVSARNQLPDEISARDDVAPDVGDEEATKPPKSKRPARPTGPTKVERIWGGGGLGTKFTPVSDYFLRNAYRLVNGNGLNSSEVMFLIHVLSHKWDDRAPFPALTTIATRMGINVRNVRKIAKRLEELGLLQRELSKHGGRSRYHLDGLFAELEKLKAADQASEDAA